ncbi:MAG: alcohol dehydrogenase catalytic domain-containing protein [Nitrospirota bacterium]
MKVAKLYGFNDIRIEDIPIPEIGPKDALIKTKACGICSGDVMPWYIEKKAPIVLGHEPAGEIVELGREVSENLKNFWSIGDRVFTHHHAPCFACRFCRRSDYVQCETWKNTKIIPGGISEYILIPETNLENDTLKLPENVSFEDGTLIEPTACVVKGLKRAGLASKKSSLYRSNVLVIGLGVMGQIHIMLALEYGAGKIIGADMIPYRLKKAKEFGADEVIDASRYNLTEILKEITAGEMADLVVVGPNSAEAMEEGISCVGAGGTVLFFTPARMGERLTIDPNYLYFRDINIVTSYSCGPTDTAEALKLIAEGVVRAEKLVTHRFPIEKTPEAFKLTSQAHDSLKSIIIFD